MKAIVLSAGQGRRLLPLTASLPKCLLPIRGKALIQWQIDTLRACGIYRITVVTGHGAEQVQCLLDRRYGHGPVTTLFNPDYARTDNLVSCWAARSEMTEDFLLLNGDTLFEAALLERVLASPPHPLTVAVSRKQTYDADDMKVGLHRCRLISIGKNLPPEAVHAESIGMILFQGQGPQLFRQALENTLAEDESANRQWYLSVIDRMAHCMPVWTCAVTGLKWCEIDYPVDLILAEGVADVCLKTAMRSRPAEGARLQRSRSAQS